jgi:hypothetical protein
MRIGDKGKAAQGAAFAICEFYPIDIEKAGDEYYMGLPARAGPGRAPGRHAPQRYFDPGKDLLDFAPRGLAIKAAYGAGGVGSFPKIL